MLSIPNVSKSFLCLLAEGIVCLLHIWGHCNKQVSTAYTFRMLSSDLDGTLKLIVSRYKISQEKSYVGRKLKSNITILLHQAFLSCSGELILRVTHLNLSP